jgi:hypothetical protein
MQFLDRSGIKGMLCRLKKWTRRSPRKQSAVRAIDTNIIVRVLTADDARQAKAARCVIEAGD